MYSENQIKAALKQACDYYEWEPNPSLSELQDEFWSLLAATEELKHKFSDCEKPVEKHFKECL